MISRLTKLVLVVTLSASIGLHWELLQSIAWMRMVIRFSQGGTLKEALAKTFDGQHPCSLCKQIDKGKKSEKQSDQQIQGKKLEFLDAREAFVFVAPSDFRLLPAFEPRSIERSTSPPVPPPRLV